MAAALKFLQRFLFVIPGKGDGELLTRDFVRLFPQDRCLKPSRT